MSETDFDRDEGRESRRDADDRRRQRQRERRARLTAKPRTRFPWSLLIQASMTLAVVIVVAIVFDWLEPLELVIVLATFAACFVATHALLHRVSGRRSDASANPLLGPVACGLTVGLSGASMWLLQQFPETDAYTNRHVIGVPSQTDELLKEQEFSGVSSFLQPAIESNEPTSSGSQLTKVEQSQTDEPIRSNVLNRVIEFQASGNFSAAESYLRRLIREEPRSSWQGDYHQWYVDHWIDWGNIQTDLDERHHCYLKALRAARSFRRDDSVVSAMIVSLERQIHDLPSLLLAGCDLKIHSVEQESQGIRIELSVLSVQHEFLRGLESKDFRVRGGDEELNGLDLSEGHSLTLPTPSNFVVLVDQSVSDPIIAESRMEAAYRFCEGLPDGAAKQMMAFADRVQSTTWTTDDRPATSLLSERSSPSSAPILRRAIRQAIDALADRDGTKDLVIVSGGNESSSPYTTATSLLQRAVEKGIRIHALVSESAKPTVHRLLSDLAQGSSGQFQTVTQSTHRSAWRELARVFPKGSYILRVPLGNSSSRNFKLIIGRGATLLHTTFDIPPKEQS